MFEHLRIHGGSASILWGYRTAAVLKRWHISKNKEGRWVLRATVDRLDAFQARQKPLLFTAPRAKGMWAWPIESITVNANAVMAQLGLPEQ